MAHRRPRPSAHEPRHDLVLRSRGCRSRHEARLDPLSRLYRAAHAPVLEAEAVNPHRYPNGASKPGFWHKARPDHVPDFVRAWHYPDADPDETQVYSVIDNPAAFVWMANYGALELNPWTSRIDSSHEPTWALIDIDPGTSTSLQEVLVLAVCIAPPPGAGLSKV